MNKSITFEVHEDPGHGWLKVPREAIDRLKIADKISEYSYEQGGKLGWVYLEEDCDASVFVEAMKLTGVNVVPRFIVVNHDSPIRRMNSFCA